MGVWTVEVDSTGTNWQHATNPPPSIGRATLASLAAAGDTVIGFDSHAQSIRPGIRSMAGQSWTNAGFRPSYKFITTDAGTRVNGFLATGRACCGLPGQLVGSVVGSADGQAWTDVRGGLAFAKPIEAVASTRVGWVALGEETYLSADEDDWRLGPPLPGYEHQAHVVNGVAVPYRLAAAAGDGEVVVISPDRVVDRGIGRPDGRIDGPHAAPEAGDAGRWRTVRTRRLLTHCGPFNGPLLFAAAELEFPICPKAHFPTSFDNYYETGNPSSYRRRRIASNYRAASGRGRGVPCRPTIPPARRSMRLTDPDRPSRVDRHRNSAVILPVK